MARRWLLAMLAVMTLRAVGESVAKVPRRTDGWERRQLPSQDAPITLHIALRQPDGGEAVERLLTAISNPQSPRYRQHLAPGQAISLSKPQPGSVDAVESWLARHGLLSSAPLFGGMYEIAATVREAEELLNTTYHIYTDGTREVVRTEAYFLPEDLAHHIDFVTPTTSFPKPRAGRGDSELLLRRRQSRPLGTRGSCGTNDDTTPTCIREVYGINYTAQANRTSFAVYATEGAFFSATDTETFLEQYNPPAAAAAPKYRIIGNGGQNETGGIEAQFETALDTQTLLGIAWPASAVLYNNGGVFGPGPGHTYDPFVQFLSQLISNSTVPSVVSFSESMPEDMMDPDYARRLCSMMGQVGARGVSLLFSSGDNGPNGDTPDGTHNQVFEPEFPASCPFVTSCGGTTDLANETAATQSTLSALTQTYFVASGGGFSNLFARPAYQADVVGRYTATQIPASYKSVSGFNASGRGIPDVSAFSTNFPVVVDGVTIPIGGTSASTPLWAAVVALLNDYEASKGRPPLGFLNPWLYSLKSGLKDITAGGNSVGQCDLLSGCTLSETLGYNVTKGWDPVTGLGSPVFAKLLEALDLCGQTGRWRDTPRRSSHTHH